MLEHPVYVRIPTEDEIPYFRRQSAAEVVISVVMMAQQAGWMRLHGFVVLPEALEMVTSPIKQGVAGMVAHLQAETIPLLTVLLSDARMIWARRFAQIDLTTQRALDARLNMLLLAPVANGITAMAEEFPYSSANPRYKSTVSVYAGFMKTAEATSALMLAAAPAVPIPAAVSVAVPAAVLLNGSSGSKTTTPEIVQEPQPPARPATVVATPDSAATSA